MAKAATKPKTKREMPDGTPVSPMVDKAMDRFDAKRAELAAQPPKPTRAPDNGDKAAFEAVCAKPRVYLCEVMLAAPIGPEKDKAKAAYVAFCEVAITAKAGRGWEEGLAQQVVDLQLELDALRAQLAGRKEAKAERHEVDLGPLNQAPKPVVHQPVPPVPLAEGRKRPRPPRS